MGQAAPTARGHTVIPKSLDTNMATHLIQGLTRPAVQCLSCILGSTLVGFQTEAARSMIQVKSMFDEVIIKDW